MRIEEIDIRGFGRLRDLRVEIHPRLTVLLGENESGKSTLQRVVRAALYGLDAGGQGRPVEKSDWARWTPWSAGPYGYTLILATDGGRRLRIAARLDRREHSAEVIEIGGGDVTDTMRVQRAVAPGVHLLGFDEAVFCATAWLGEDGLRAGSVETASQKVRQLQEAIERIADTGRGTTAAQAQRRLEEALDRVGTERRSTSPLGAALTQIRRLESQIDQARRARDAYAQKEEELRSLESRAEAARATQLDAERAWLVGRLAAIAAARLEQQRINGQIRELQATIAQTAHAAGVRIEDESIIRERVGEWRQARAAAAELDARWETEAPRLQAARRRRRDIAAGLAALGDVVDVDAATLADRSRLGADLEAAAAEADRLGTTTAIDTRVDALRQEIAATGLGSIRIGNADTVGGLVDTALGVGESPLGGVIAAASAMAGIGLAALLAAGHHAAWGGRAAIAGMVGALAVWAVSRLRGSARHARRQLARLCPGIDLSREGLERTAERLPGLVALHDDLIRQQARAAAHREQVEAAAQRITATVAEIAELAAPFAASATDEHSLTAGRRDLDLIDRAAEIAARHSELLEEDTRLAEAEAQLIVLEAEVGRATGIARELESDLCRRLHLDDGHFMAVQAAVARFSDLCEARRRHDQAVAVLTDLLPHASSEEDDTVLHRNYRRLGERLRDRGGDLDEIATARALSTTELHALEAEAENSQMRADTLARQAGELRGHLAGAFAGLGNLADLEDDLAAAVAVRDRCLAQRNALQRAIDLIDDSTRDVHLDLAPRLAASIAERLGLLTDARYTGVNVDVEHFEISLAGRERPEMIPLDLVSHGTRDQVGLLLRLALADVLSGGGETVPLFLDEPLLSADPHRRGLSLDFLCNLSAEHQTILTTSDPAIAQAIKARMGDDAAVVELRSPAEDLAVDGVAIDLASARRRVSRA